MEKLTRNSRDIRLVGFKGLSEREINRLYSLATIKTLQGGDVLVREGDVDQAVYVILNGKITIVKDMHGQTQETATLHEGDWLGEIASVRQAPRTESAVAAEPSRVMAIDKDTVNSLEEKTQMFFYKRLHHLANARISQLEAREKELVCKSRQLMEDIFSQRTRGKIDLHSSEMIQDIIKKIPRLPVFANNLVIKLLGDLVSSREVADEIKKDPSLVGVVLKTINSSYYGFHKKISDIHQAIVLLGFNEIHQLVIAEGIRRTMPDTPIFQELHSHCIAVSHIAFELSRESQLSKPAQMATIGLLHDIGQIVIQLLKERNPKLAMFIGAIDRAQMGSLLLKAWNLPDVVWRSVEFQFYPEFSLPTNVPVEVRNNVVILYIAHLCHEFLRGRPEHELPTTFLDEYRRLLNRERFSLADMTRKWVLPGLTKKMNSLPASLRQLLKKHM